MNGVLKLKTVNYVEINFILLQLCSKTSSFSLNLSTIAIQLKQKIDMKNM